VRNLTPAKLVVMIVMAMGLLIAVYIGKQLMAKEPPPQTATRTVPMPVADLAPGTIITDEHIGMGPWPADDIEGDVLLGRSAISGRVVKKPLKAAEPIHGNALYPMGELPPLTVSDGYRAVTIQLTDSAAIMNGLLRPGDHADVEFTPTEGTSDERYSKIGGMSVKLFKGVRLLAINVTLEIADDDVALLRLADENGDLFLSYTPEPAGIALVDVKDPNRPTLEELLQLPPVPEEPEEPEPDVFRSWLYSGASGQQQTFVDGVPSRSGYSGNSSRNRPADAPGTRPGGGYDPNSPGGAPGPGYQGAPGGRGGGPSNGDTPFFQRQTRTGSPRTPGNRERGTQNGNSGPDFRRTARNL